MDLDRTIVRRRVPKILVVDADSQTVLTAASVLESSGTQVVVARSGQEALELLMKGTVDLIFLDISLPGMDGLDVTRIIKSQPELAGIPILLTSQRVDRSLFAFGIQLGAVDFIRKPIPEKTLVNYAWQVLKRIGFVPPKGLPETDGPGVASLRAPKQSY
jgi:CheY-like chemotaxis protein